LWPQNPYCQHKSGIMLITMLVGTSAYIGRSPGSGLGLESSGYNWLAGVVITDPVANPTGNRLWLHHRARDFQYQPFVPASIFDGTCKDYGLKTWGNLRTCNVTCNPVHETLYM
jgi:hypothetical protein